VIVSWFLERSPLSPMAALFGSVSVSSESASDESPDASVLTCSKASCSSLEWRAFSKGM